MSRDAMCFRLSIVFASACFLLCPIFSAYSNRMSKEMAKYADALIAFWDGKSKGTEYGIKYSQKKEIPVMVIKGIN